VLHKLSITAEAEFDLSESLGLPQLDKRTLKAEVEEYIIGMNKAGRIPWWGYFRADYLDEDSGKLLKLFIYNGGRLGLMQFWDLAGVCLASEWSEEAEEKGLIRLWLRSKITDLIKGDWVVEQQARAAADMKNGGRERQATITGLSKEQRDEIERGDN